MKWSELEPGDVWVVSSNTLLAAVTVTVTPRRFYDQSRRSWREDDVMTITWLVLSTGDLVSYQYWGSASILDAEFIKAGEGAR